MTTRVCLIGNCHIAALKVSLRDGVFSHPNFEFTFWGARGRTFFDVRYEDGKLIAPDREIVLLLSGGLYEELNPHDFDVLVFHGLAVNYTRMLLSLRASSSVYSAGFLVAGLHEYLDGRPSCQLIKQVCQTFKGRTLVSAQPMILEQSGRMIDIPIAKTTHDSINDALSRYFAEFGAEYLPQPASTVIDHRYTAARFFIRGGDLKAKNNPELDFTHLNEHYGAEVLQSIVARIGTV